jgi:hypothetical protein
MRWVDKVATEHGLGFIKRAYLKVFGYRLMTEDVVQELLFDLPEGIPSNIKMSHANWLRTFVWYKRYSDTIVPYSREYIERTSIGKLAAYVVWNYIRYSRMYAVLVRTLGRLKFRFIDAPRIRRLYMQFGLEYRDF